MLHTALGLSTPRLPSSILKPKISQLDSRPMNAVCRATRHPGPRAQLINTKVTYVNFTYSMKNNFAKEQNKDSRTVIEISHIICARRAQRHVRTYVTYGKV